MLGTIELNNHCWRDMRNKTVDARAIVTDEDVDDSIVGVTHAKNSLVKRCGRSSHQAAFGREPQMPGALMDDRNMASMHDNIKIDERLQLQEFARHDGLRSFAEWESNEAVRRSINRKTANQQDISQLVPGMK